MLRIKTALATGLVLGLTSLTASAGELSYESRGYGGPLYIGPNFQQGGQHETPIYGSGSGSYSRSHESSRGSYEERENRHVAKKKSRVQDEDVAEKKKSNDDGDATEKKAAAKTEDSGAAKSASKADDKTGDQATKKAETENSSITGSVGTDTAEVAGSAAVKSTASNSTTSNSASTNTEGCRHFVAAVGRVINVPCD